MISALFMRNKPLKNEKSTFGLLTNFKSLKMNVIQEKYNNWMNFRISIPSIK
ncbi:hypothetical protein ABNIH4_05913 [Acinetobacter baumannii ABNIH4]|nr:hypothetical protein ABNIH4_05913 [Acinetobacter baumannii ABNIH4]EJP48682.1 hypothetical protein ACINNAV18_1562 [Acinetobacter baumannii Naval-18]EMT83260.1 hypothetical protein ABNIH25_16194 [Acinetobacter baumannii ABNIH25]